MLIGDGSNTVQFDRISTSVATGTEFSVRNVDFTSTVAGTPAITHTSNGSLNLNNCTMNYTDTGAAITTARAIEYGLGMLGIYDCNFKVTLNANAATTNYTLITALPGFGPNTGDESFIMEDSILAVNTNVSATSNITTVMSEGGGKQPIRMIRNYHEISPTASGELTGILTICGYNLANSGGLLNFLSYKETFVLNDRLSTISSGTINYYGILLTGDGTGTSGGIEIHDPVYKVDNPGAITFNVNGVVQTVGGVGMVGYIYNGHWDRQNFYPVDILTALNPSKSYVTDNVKSDWSFGGVSRSITGPLFSNYIVNGFDHTILLSENAGVPVVVTLPLTTNTAQGRIIWTKSVSTAVTYEVVANGGESINNGGVVTVSPATVSVASRGHLVLQSNGAGVWYVISP